MKHMFNQLLKFFRYYHRAYVTQVEDQLKPEEQVILNKSYIRIVDGNLWTEDGWFFITNKRFIIRSEDKQDDRDIPLDRLEVQLVNSDKLFAYTKGWRSFGWHTQPYIMINHSHYSLAMKLRAWESRYMNLYGGYAGDHAYLGLFLMIQKLRKGDFDVKTELDVMSNRIPTQQCIELAQQTFGNLILYK